ncbi:MAG: DUF3302 domain-containing protein [Dechloromonas sp.]|nr:DUF3302 domain-containing protein [Candidatus Dechloromonas phosphoritropha]
MKQGGHQDPYLTFATLFLAGIAVVACWVWLAGLPGRIAIARKHPDAEAVNLLGWAGLLPTIYPWVQAFIWAFKPADIVDIRRFPREEARAIYQEIDRLEGGADAKNPRLGGDPGKAAPTAATSS